MSTKHSGVLLDVILHFCPEEVRGAEVGVLYGGTSAYLLNKLPGLHLTCVDPWSEQYNSNHGLSDREPEQRPQQKLDDMHKFVVNRLEPYGERVHIIRQPSHVAACGVRNMTLDFVFIDAHHTYDSVLTDLQLWYPKLKVGGIIACHDYGGRFRGVAKAMRHFMRKQLKSRPVVCHYKVAYGRKMHGY